MRKSYTKYGVLVALIAAPILLSGCTPMTEEQITSIRETANSAKAEADRAMSIAERALAMANKAEADAQAANEKIDRMFQKSLRK
jgi:hypothetical protein